MSYQHGLKTMNTIMRATDQSLMTFSTASTSSLHLHSPLSYNLDASPAFLPLPFLIEAKHYEGIGLDEQIILGFPFC